MIKRKPIILSIIFLLLITLSFCSPKKINEEEAEKIIDLYVKKAFQYSVYKNRELSQQALESVIKENDYSVENWNNFLTENRKFRRLMIAKENKRMKKNRTDRAKTMIKKLNNIINKYLTEFFKSPLSVKQDFDSLIEDFFKKEDYPEKIFINHMKTLLKHRKSYNEMISNYIIEVNSKHDFLLSKLEAEDRKKVKNKISGILKKLEKLKTQ